MDEGAIYLILILMVYFMPSFIASARSHANVVSIVIVNLFFGWTLIGWVGCLAWSFSNNRRVRV